MAFLLKPLYFVQVFILSHGVCKALAGRFLLQTVQAESSYCNFLLFSLFYLFIILVFS